MCAFLEFDQELLAARYRAAEQALWLLVRAARLVGGRNGGGRVLVQTRMPDHEVLATVTQPDPARILAAEEARRRALAFPPFGGLAEVTGANRAVEAAVRALDREPSLSVLGPVRKGATLHALVHAPSVDRLCDALAEIDFAPAREHGRLRVDVDPLRV